MDKRLWIGHVVIAIVSLTAAFFGVFNVLFSDVFGISGHLQAIAYVLIIYALAGFLATRAWPAGRRAWRWWLIVPALLIGLPYSFGDGAFGWYPLGVLGAVVIGSLLGTGVRWRRRSSAV